VKSIILGLSFIFLSVSGFAGTSLRPLDQKLVRFETNPPQIHPGNAYHGFIYLTTDWSSSDEVRTVVRAWMDNQELTLIHPDANTGLWVFAGAPFADVGTHNVNVNISLEDKVDSDQMRASITQAQQDIAVLNAQIAIEEDPNQKVILEAQRDAKQALVSDYQNQLNQGRTDIGNDTFTLNVVN
jgi:hypothetical protein